MDKCLKIQIFRRMERRAGGESVALSFIDQRCSGTGFGNLYMRLAARFNKQYHHHCRGWGNEKWAKKYSMFTVEWIFTHEFFKLSNYARVTVAQCEAPVEPNPPLSLRLEGLKLGQRAVYRCPMGYILQGTPNATCLASGECRNKNCFNLCSFFFCNVMIFCFMLFSSSFVGNFSSPAPTCIPIQCPPLFLEDPHLSLIELNTSAWGRAVFSCSWGYRLSGPSNLECLASGHWSGPIPRCRGECREGLMMITFWITARIDEDSVSFSPPLWGEIAQLSSIHIWILEIESPGNLQKNWRERNLMEIDKL